MIASNIKNRCSSICFSDIQSLGPIIGAAVFLTQLDNNNNNKLANQKIYCIYFPPVV